MNAITHHFAQHSPAWHAHRASHFNASDAAVMLGLSPYRSRADLVRAFATGLPQEHEETTLRVFARGHQSESLARPLAEAIIGEELYPVVMSRVVDGLPLSASLDGLTLAGDIAWEHKLSNAELVEQLDAGAVPPPVAAQCEQILLVSGAQKVLAMASDGREESVRSAWYVSDPKLRARLLDGWRAFAADVAAYTGEASPPAATARPLSRLPALLMQIEGRVIQTNLAEFADSAKALMGSLQLEPATDEEFAQAEATVKFCKEAEERIELVKRQALAQTAEIDQAFRLMDSLREELRAARLRLEKQVKARKDQLRAELIAAGCACLAGYATELNATLPHPWLAPIQAPLLGEAIKGLKSLASCQQAIDGRVLELRMELHGRAQRLKANHATLQQDGRDWSTLFPDFATVGLREAEEFAALADLRIRKHLEAEAEAERAKAAAAPPEPVTPPTAAPPPAAPPEPVATTGDAPQAPAGFASGELPDLAIITAFMRAHDFGRDHSRVRSILVEFVKFQASHHASATAPQQVAA